MDKKTKNIFVLDTYCDEKLHPGQTKATPSVKLKMKYFKGRCLPSVR